MATSLLLRRTFLKAATVAAGGLALARPGPAAGAPAARGRRPNIVMMYADDLDFDELAPYDVRQFPCRTGMVQRGLSTRSLRFYRDARMLTPHIDRLAAEGATLTRFYITSAICTPSRYSVLTGRYASRSPGFCRRFPPGTPANIQWNTPLAPDETNVARALKACGYATGVVGKWHNSGPGGRVRGIAADADPFDPKLSATCHQAQETLCRYLREEIGFDYAARIYHGNKEELGLPKAMQVHNLEWIAEGALDFIEANRARPFLLYMPLTTPHGGYGSNFLKANPRFTPAGVLEKAPAVMPPRQSIIKRVQEKDIDRRNAMATWIDDCVGAVMAKLEALGLADDTVFIFVSDHQSRGKYTCYEGARVPCIVRWPGKIQAGSRVGALCANIDLVPTFVEMAGGRVPETWTVDGRSMVPALTGRETPDDRRKALLLEVSNIRAVVTDRFKYVANRPGKSIADRMQAEAKRAKATAAPRRLGWDGKENPHTHEKGVRYGADLDFPHYFDPDQLYDLEADPFEQTNLAGQATHAETLRRMKDLLARQLVPLPHTFAEFKTE